MAELAVSSLSIHTLHPKAGTWISSDFSGREELLGIYFCSDPTEGVRSSAGVGEKKYPGVFAFTRDRGKWARKRENIYIYISV